MLVCLSPALFSFLFLFHSLHFEWRLILHRATTPYTTTSKTWSKKSKACVLGISSGVFQYSIESIHFRNGLSQASLSPGVYCSGEQRGWPFWNDRARVSRNGESKYQGQKDELSLWNSAHVCPWSGSFSQRSLRGRCSLHVGVNRLDLTAIFRSKQIYNQWNC